VIRKGRRSPYLCTKKGGKRRILFCSKREGVKRDVQEDKGRSEYSAPVERFAYIFTREEE